MRIVRLWMERYGHVSGEALEFPGDRGLHVVVGANEAGKSTALEAVADGLFGWTKDSRKFRHPDDPRVGFTLRAADGSEASFVRSKKRRDNLTDGEGRVVPEAALLRFLGGTSRARFREVFGLDGERLRQGGRTILSEHGEAGAAVLQAQTGLHGLRETVKRLDGEAGKLFGDGRGRRVINLAAAAVRENRRLVGERSLSGAEYGRAAEGEAELGRRLEAIRRETQGLRAEQQRLDRIRRTAAIRRDMAGARLELEQLGAAPDLPADAAAVREAALLQAEQARRDLMRDRADLAGFEAKLGAVALDPAILAEANVVDALGERRIKIEEDARDRIKVSGQAGERLEAVNRAAARLGVAERGAALRERIPGAAARSAAGRLIQEQTMRLGTLQSAEQALAAAVRGVDVAREGLAGASVVAGLDELVDAVELAGAEGPIDRVLAEAEVTAGGAGTTAAAALSGLALWSGDAERLQASPVPLASEVIRLAGALEAAEAERVGAMDAVVRHERGFAAAREAVASEEQAGGLPDAGVSGAVRARRDAAWRAIRRHYVEGGEVGATEVPVAELPGLLDRLLGEADALADLRSSEARRVQRWEAARAEVARLEAGLGAVEAARDASEGAYEGRLDEWRRAWAGAGVCPLGPAAMRDWVREREAVLEAYRRALEAARALEGVRVRHSGAMGRLRRVLPGVDEGGGVAGMLVVAKRRRRQLEEEGKVRESAVGGVRRAEAELVGARAEMAGVEGQVAGWLGRWAPVAAGLGLAGEAGLEGAADVIERWSGLEGALREWEALDVRVRDMTDSIEGYEASRAALAVRLGVPDEAGLVPGLERRLAAAQVAARDWAAWTEDRAAAVARIGGHERLAAEAAGVLEALRRRVGVVDDAGLEEAIARGAAHGRWGTVLRERMAELRALDDGLSEAALEAEAEGVDRDAILGRLGEIEDRLGALEGEQIQVVAAREALRGRLVEMARGQDVAGPAQAVQDGLIEIEEAASRYVRLRLAHALLKGGVERFRRSQQGPILARASGYFAELTGGRYERLEPDEDERGEQVIVAVRPDGTSCPADLLSEGTCDQFFLALRLASIAVDAAVAEPMPFIADDLLVNFDDRRARAALGLLGAFGRQTQVVLFTHHEHLLPLADPLVSSVHRLPRELAVA